MGHAGIPPLYFVLQAMVKMISLGLISLAKSWQLQAECKTCDLLFKKLCAILTLKHDVLNFDPEHPRGPRGGGMAARGTPGVAAAF